MQFPQEKSTLLQLSALRRMLYNYLFKQAKKSFRNRSPQNEGLLNMLSRFRNIKDDIQTLQTLIHRPKPLASLPSLLATPKSKMVPIIRIG